MDWFLIVVLALFSIAALIVAVVATLAASGAIIPISLAVGAVGIFSTVKFVEWKLEQ